MTTAFPLELLLRLDQVRSDGPGVRVFDFVHAEGGPLPPFDAGAHLLLEAAPGTVRSYSLCNDPAESARYQLAVLREPASSGGSAAMHMLEPGQIVRASQPRNAFPLDEQAPCSVLVAGGIGITPMLAMAERLLRLGREFELHYCCRDRARAAFLAHLAQPRFNGRVHLHFDDEAPAQRFDAQQVLSSCEVGTQVYMCGPQGFMDSLVRTARTLQLPEASLHREDFTGVVLEGEAAADGPFEMVLAASGRIVSVARGQTALDALERAGVPVFSSCAQGICGTCAVGVLGGEPDHRDHCLTEEVRARNDCFLPCCSRSRSPQLVVDL
ncbi:MAG: PDR/VanB family oxidoreductase [Variovorax sp.]